MSKTLAQTYAGRRVFITGHTGFKGSWLSLWLVQLGAEVTGFSRDVPTSPAAFDLMRLANDLSDQRGDISDAALVQATIWDAQPEVLFHLAAQPIVRDGFADPFGTFQTNIMGTASVLEAARQVPSVRAVIVVTSDKVYQNSGSIWPFRESDPLGGHEPYGASKAGAEVITDVYRSTAFHHAAGSANQPALMTVRAGNVIGGGDWAAHRLIPDFVRAVSEGRQQTIRQPKATRPWQHVLEPLGGYLCAGAALLEQQTDLPPALNFGPAESRMPDVQTVAKAFVTGMDADPAMIDIQEDFKSGEAPTLRVDSSLAGQVLGWRPAWTVERAVSETANWYRHWRNKPGTMRDFSLKQLDDYRSSSPVFAIR